MIEHDLTGRIQEESSKIDFQRKFRKRKFELSDRCLKLLGAPGVPQAHIRTGRLLDWAPMCNPFNKNSQLALALSSDIFI